MAGVTRRVLSPSNPFVLTPPIPVSALPQMDVPADSLS
jgi:hypothetical protein